MKSITLFCLIATAVSAGSAPENEAGIKPSRDENGVFQFRVPAMQEELAFAFTEIVFPEKWDVVETPEDAYALLTSEGFVPNTPWRTGQVVTRADLAMLSARLLDAPEEVDRDNPIQCLTYLKEQGVRLRSVGEALKAMETLYHANYDGTHEHGASKHQATEAADHHPVGQKHGGLFQGFGRRDEHALPELDQPLSPRLCPSP